MSFLSSTTTVGIAKALVAQANSVFIQITSASFSSDLLTQDTVVLAAVTSLAHVTYTADITRLAYRAMPDGKTAMLRIALPTTAAFNFGSYSLNLADGTPFIVGTWDSLQIKTINQIRYIEQNIVLSTLLPTITLTILNNIDATLPEVANETDLPTPSSTGYNVYYVDQLTTYGNLPALASQFGGVWYYYPSDRNSGVTPGNYNNVTVDARGRVIAASSINYAVTLIGDATGSGNTGNNITVTLANSGIVAGTYNTITINAKGIATFGTNSGWVLKAGDTMTGNLILNAGRTLYVDSVRFISDIGQNTGIDWGNEGQINFINNGAVGTYINSGGNLISQPGHVIYSDHFRFISDTGSGIDWGGIAGYINIYSENIISAQISPTHDFTTWGHLRALVGAVGANDAIILSDLVLWAATPGYIKFPNNFMIQWGTIAVLVNSGFNTPAFPFGFAHNCLGMVSGFDSNSAVSVVSMGTNPINAGTFGVIASETSLEGFTADIWYIAVGN